MSKLEWLVLGFWIWHSCEWIYGSFFQDRNYKRKVWEIRELEKNRLEKEVEYWTEIATKASLELEILNYEVKKKGYLAEDFDKK